MEHVTYFHICTKDGTVSEHVTRKGMRYCSLAALKTAMSMLKLHPMGAFIFWGDTRSVLLNKRPEKVPFCFCSETYRAPDGRRCADLAYYDASGVKRDIDPTKLLAHFTRG